MKFVAAFVFVAGVGDSETAATLPALNEGARCYQSHQRQTVKSDYEGDYSGPTERVHLIAVCQCLAVPLLHASKAATKSSLQEVACAGQLLYSRATYNVTQTSDCFVGSVRENRQNTRSVSRLFVETKTPTHPKNHVYPKDTWTLDKLQYQGVCNSDATYLDQLRSNPPEQLTTQAPTDPLESSQQKPPSPRSMRGTRIKQDENEGPSPTQLTRDTTDL